MRNELTPEIRSESPYIARERWTPDFEDCEVEIINTDMDKEVSDKVLRISLRTIITNRESLASCDLESENKVLMAVAKAIKSNLSIAMRRENPWQVIIGRSYGSFVTHEAKLFLFFKFVGLSVTIFVSG